MGRLIDADEYCAKHCVRNCSESQRSACSLGTIPTAYDVEDVVKQIKEFYPDAEQYGFSGAITDIIEIVRRGGVSNE